MSSNSYFRPTLLAFEEHVDSVVVQKDGINQATGAVKVQLQTYLLIIEIVIYGIFGQVLIVLV